MIIKNKNIALVSDFSSKMKNPNNILEIENLHTYFYTDHGTVKAVNGISFDIPKGSTVGIVGESGCGKSVTSLSVLRLLQEPAARIVDGSIRYDSEEGCVDITKMPVKTMKNIRGREISMIFQEPMQSLNPVFTVGNQIDEVFIQHNGCSKRQAKQATLELLFSVGIKRRETVYKNYPHQLSGGMRQRIMIAMAVACRPKLIIADEPTTALDVTVKAQILSLLKDIKIKTNCSLLLITHDLGVVAEMADYIIVMYAGKIVEKGRADEVMHNPKHPYTVGLMKSNPSLTEQTDRLYGIPGNVPKPVNLPDSCYFKDRCEYKHEKCCGKYPKMVKLSNTHHAACYLCEKGAD